MYNMYVLAFNLSPPPCHVDQMTDIFSHYELQQMIVMDKFFI